MVLMLLVLLAGHPAKVGGFDAGRVLAMWAGVAGFVEWSRWLPVKPCTDESRDEDDTAPALSQLNDRASTSSLETVGACPLPAASDRVNSYLPCDTASE